MRLPERASRNSLHGLRQQKENRVAAFCEMGTSTRPETAFLMGRKYAHPMPDDAKRKAAGKRDVPLSPGMAQQLLALRRDEYRGPEAPVFASNAGTPLRPENVYRRALAPAAIGAGFKLEVEVDGKKKVRSAVSFHTFRHTCASLLFEAGGT